MLLLIVLVVGVLVAMVLKLIVYLLLLLMAVLLVLPHLELVERLLFVVSPTDRVSPPLLLIIPRLVFVKVVQLQPFLGLDLGLGVVPVPMVGLLHHAELLKLLL